MAGKGEKGFLSRPGIRVFPASGLGFSPGETRLHRIHPVAKLALLVLFSVLVFVYSRVAPAVFLFALLLAVATWMGEGLPVFLRKMRFVFFFAATVFLIQVLAVREGVLWLAIPFFQTEIGVWSGGVESGLVLVLRFVNVIGASYVFVTTTDPNGLSYSLMQMGLPYRFGFMLITALRFIPVFYQDLAMVRNAQKAKGIDVESLRPRSLPGAVRHILLPLVISALNKVDSLSVSMESRAFGLYPTRSYLEPRKPTWRDWAVLVCGAGVLLGLVPLF